MPKRNPNKVIIQRCNDSPQSSFRIVRIDGALEINIRNGLGKTKSYMVGDIIAERQDIRALCEQTSEYSVTLRGPAD